MLHACGVNSDITLRHLGGAPFLCFEAPAFPSAQQAFLYRFSALSMAAVLENDLLRPLDAPVCPPFPEDMPEILKYKGKTNSDFTRLMLNLALACGGQWQTAQPHVVDPICGRGTTLYCAFTQGFNATGIDSDRKSIAEGVTFSQKWLQYHRIKHTLKRTSLTIPGGKSAPCTSMTATDALGAPCTLRFLYADTRYTDALLQRCRAQALLADLPYGVQHAPTENGSMSTLEKLLKDSLSAWRQALLPGCAAAISFNTYTLKRETLLRLCLEAGFILPPAPMDMDFSHWVEQAVQRDILLVVNP